MMQDLVTRFAPSPTGLLHLGHAWSALQSHDKARATDGRFLLRIEDIDQTRCRPEFVDSIYRDLEWLGLEWDSEVIIQSERLADYHAAFEQLKSRELVYQCWCTRADVQASASAPQGEEGPIYPGTCKGLSGPDDDRPSCWRLDAQAAMNRVGTINWHDSGHGSITADLSRHGDVVLVRKDIPTSYHLAVTVDDAAQGVTDIVRGQDLFTASHVHIVLQALLGYTTPRYYHHALISGGDGGRLAKRKRSAALADLRAAGVDPKGLVDLMRQGLLPDGYSFT